MCVLGGGGGGGVNVNFYRCNALIYVSMVIVKKDFKRKRKKKKEITPDDSDLS